MKATLSCSNLKKIYNKREVVKSSSIEVKQGEIVGLNMPVNARNVELANAYINMSLDKGFQSKIDSVLRSRSARVDVDPSPETLKLIGPADNTTYADWAFLSKNRPKITEMWNEVFG